MTTITHEGIKAIMDEGLDVKKLLDLLTDTEKRQALALLQGMVIGKELAEKKDPT